MSSPGAALLATSYLTTFFVLTEIGISLPYWMLGLAFAFIPLGWFVDDKLGWNTGAGV